MADPSIDINEGPFSDLPPNLPVPKDDGACTHLSGRSLPDIALLSTSCGLVNLRQRPGLVVVYIYPMTGRPGVPLPSGWDDFPGARGCTPESCAFRDLYEEIRKFNAEIFGLSTQSNEYQREVHERLKLPFDLLSDNGFVFTDALSLPTFSIASMRLLRRLTLVSVSGVIERVFYPVFPPDRHAAEVVAYLAARKA